MLVLVVAAAAVAACDETLEGGLGCGALCPEEPSELRQDTLQAVQLDTTLGGFPPIGAEPQLLLSARGDTLDARVIVRFDSLPTTFRHNNTAVDSNIVDVDSAYVLLRLVKVDTLGPDITVEAYDVDVTEGDDTTVAVLAPLFEPSRLLGSVTYDPTTLKDTVRVPIDSAKLRAKIQADGGQRLRVGIRITAASSAELQVSASNSGNYPKLIFKASPAATVPMLDVSALSKTPLNTTLAADLLDFQLIVKAPPPPPPNVLRLGGVPGERGYMRFDIPALINDSSTIVRAQLVLTQRPNPEGAASADTGAVQVFALAAGGVLTDLNRVLLFLSASFDSTRVVPADSGARNFEIIEIVRSWRGTTAERTPRAVALRATTEGSTAWQVDFYSNEAPAAVRPRLIITYVPQPAPRIP